jgi:coiled-coil domain-containing protein 12
VATRKVNWDLKRDVQYKMEKLERRTQRAIVGLLRERLEREAAEGGGDDGGEGDSDLD